jgi:hypothetical protein
VKETLNKEKNILAALPKVTSIRDNITRNRNKIIGYSKETRFDIPESLKYDKNGNLFLRFDSGMEDENRYIIFYTKFKEEKFKTMDVFIIDGTFKSSPPEFNQLVTIHVHFLDKAFTFI